MDMENTANRPTLCLERVDVRSGANPALILDLTNKDERATAKVGQRFPSLTCIKEAEVFDAH